MSVIRIASYVHEIIRMTGNKPASGSVCPNGAVSDRRLDAVTAGAKSPGVYLLGSPPLRQMPFHAPHDLMRLHVEHVRQQHQRPDSRAPKPSLHQADVTCGPDGRSEPGAPERIRAPFCESPAGSSQRPSLGPNQDGSVGGAVPAKHFHAHSVPTFIPRTMVRICRSDVPGEHRLRQHVDTV